MKQDNGNHAAHTPGPWRIGYDDGSGKDWPPFSIQSVATGEKIVDAASGEADMKSWELGVLTIEDARLIVAAPETAVERDRLKAINMNLTYALRTLAGPLPHGSKDDAAAFVRRIACAALAKAKGETQ